MSRFSDRSEPEKDALMQALDALRYQQALGAGGIGTWWYDTESGSAQWDAMASELLGNDGMALEADSQRIIHPDDLAEVMESLRCCADTGSVHDVEFRPMRCDGQTRWLRSIARPSSDSSFGRRWLTGVLFDVTDRRAVETALRESRRQLATLLNNLPGVAYRCEAYPPWHMEFVSTAVKEITGYDPSEFRDRNLGWSDIMHPDDVVRVAKEVEHAIEIRRPFSVRYRIIHRNGDVLWLHERGEASYHEAGSAAFLEGFIWDVSDQHAASERLQWTASHDGLTKLPNRLLFQQHVEDALARAGDSGGQVGILMLDLDDFKIINDTLGHDAGDALLRGVAERLSMSIRPCDTVARLSGDEFAILVENGANRSIIQRSGTKIMASFEEPFVHDGRLFDCRASVGVAIYPGSDSERSTLMKDADIALYAAKGEGGGKLKFYEPSMRRELEGRSAMLQIARDALANGWIVPHYQPKVDLVSGRIEGFEALLRWTHPIDGIQMPETLGAAFEDLDLAAAISDRMISRIIGDICAWRAQGLDYGHIAINAAAAEFRRGNFPETLLGRLAAADILPQHIQIEVTETVFLGRGAEYVETALKLLSAAGITIALDDFGTGYASLSHLKQFPVDVIKIDKSFVRDLQEERDDAAIVLAVISLGRNLGIRIVAEGIETAAQALHLRTAGCDYGQGYYFGAAMDCDAITELLAHAAPVRQRRLAG